MKVKKLNLQLIITNMESEINKSPNDSRVYRYLVLENKLECILVVDKETIKSAACLHIHVGAALEPKDTPGLAHFLEHMLFLGTEKYPIDTEYSKFISDHGGNENAETSQIGTSYYFDIMNEQFEKALDMFAEFFKTPLFNPESVEKEMKAVDSEFSSIAQSDADRILQIFESNSNPESAFNRFYAGNMKTLKKEGIENELKQFHDKWYSSNVMRLCIYSNTESIESTAIELFSKIVNQDIEIPSFADPPAYSQDYLGNLFRVKSVMDENQIIFTIVYPYYGKDYYDYSLQYNNKRFRIVIYNYQILKFDQL